MNQNEWMLCSVVLPENGVVVETKIDDQRGCRNETTLKRQNRLWFTPDGNMYVYYQPTHWRHLEANVEPPAATPRSPELTGEAWWIHWVPYIETYMHHMPWCKAITLEDFDNCTCGLKNILGPMLKKRLPASSRRLVMGNGDYSCATCGMGMLEPCNIGSNF